MGWAWVGVGGVEWSGEEGRGGDRQREIGDLVVCLLLEEIRREEENLEISWRLDGSGSGFACRDQRSERCFLSSRIFDRIKHACCVSTSCFLLLTGSNR